MCRQEFLEYPEQSYNDILLVLLVMLNLVISFLAILSNLVVIYTFFKRPSLRTPSNILILSLAVSDFGVGLMTGPSFCVYKLAELKRNAAVLCASFKAYMSTLFWFGSFSFCILTAITFDRFLAVSLHLRYQQTITTRRYGILLALFWILSAFTGFLKILLENLATATFGFVLLACGLLINFFCIFKISRVVQRHSRQIQVQQETIQIQAQQQSVQQSIDMPRYKKSVKTMYYVIGAFILSYIPTVIALIPYYVVQKYTRNIRLLFGFSETFVMVNGVLNPIIYCWRFKEIRTVAHGLWGRVRCKDNTRTPGQTPVECRA